MVLWGLVSQQVCMCPVHPGIVLSNCLHAQAQEMERHNMALASHASTVEAQQGAIHAQLAEYTQRLRATEAQNDALQREIAHMRAFIAVRAPWSPGRLNTHVAWCGCTLVCRRTCLRPQQCVSLL